MADLISLDAFRKKKEAQAREAAYPGIMVWLYCPTCKSLEYTEVRAPYGRKHSCGTQVLEEEVSLDFRAEATITLRNLKVIAEKLEETSKNKLVRLASKGLQKALSLLQQGEEVYLSRLSKAAGRNLEPYEGADEDLEKQLPIKATNPLGLWVSEFRFQPEKRFPQEES